MVADLVRKRRTTVVEKGEDGATFQWNLSSLTRQPRRGALDAGEPEGAVAYCAHSSLRFGEKFAASEHLAAHTQTRYAEKCNNLT
jgi:hypothetical protein